jgi:hypothetical protein
LKRLRQNELTYATELVVLDDGVVGKLSEFGFVGAIERARFEVARHMNFIDFSSCDALVAYAAALGVSEPRFAMQSRISAAERSSPVRRLTRRNRPLSPALIILENGIGR